MDGNRKVTRFSVYHVFILRHLFTFSIFSLVELVGLKIGKKLLSWYAKCSLGFPSRGLKNVACLSSQLFHRGSQRNVSKWKSLVWDAQRVLESFFRRGGGGLLKIQMWSPSRCCRRLGESSLLIYPVHSVAPSSLWTTETRLKRIIFTIIIFVIIMLL